MTQKKLWFVPIQATPTPTFRLFCLPYAGGGTYIYKDWGNDFPANIELIAVQPPGRGRRLTEPPFTEIHALIQTLGQQLLTHYNDGVPFAFFGHSMGALVSFYLADYLRRTNNPQPQYLFASGHRAPHVPSRYEPVHKMPKKQFIDKLSEYNGTPQEILDNPEFLELFLPTLRADFTLCETYNYQTLPPFPYPIYAFGGREDPQITTDDINEWHIHTTNTFDMQMFDGDHFFLRDAQTAITNTIRNTILNN